MSDQYETAQAWAGESIKAIATGVGGSVFAIVGGFFGADLFDNSNTYWCFEEGVMYAPAGQQANILDAPLGCKKAVMLPVVGPVFSAEQAGLLIGGAIALAVLVLAGTVMFYQRKKHAP
ncbi:hypothetical protein [Streptomyces sp. NPDC060022]|uniref:hypothetical protein n=1 Tax=Streptomyces sp. NPDC060022 TaxID=3347039 RepID=UPI0036BC74A9